MTHITMEGSSHMEFDPAYPWNWTPEMPLAILGDPKGHDPYNHNPSAVPSNHRLTPAHPNLDDTAEILVRFSR